MKEEIHVDEPEDKPIMRTILEQVGERHGVAREPVNPECFKFSFNIVPNYHGQTNLLVEDKFLLSIDLLLECSKNT